MSRLRSFIYALLIIAILIPLIQFSTHLNAKAPEETLRVLQPTERDFKAMSYGLRITWLHESPSYGEIGSGIHFIKSGSIGRFEWKRDIEFKYRISIGGKEIKGVGHLSVWYLGTISVELTYFPQLKQGDSNSVQKFFTEGKKKLKTYFESLPRAYSRSSSTTNSKNRIATIDTDIRFFGIFYRRYQWVNPYHVNVDIIFVEYRYLKPNLIAKINGELLVLRGALDIASLPWSDLINKAIAEGRVDFEENPLRYGPKEPNELRDAIINCVTTYIERLGSAVSGYAVQKTETSTTTTPRDSISIEQLSVEPLDGDRLSLAIKGSYTLFSAKRAEVRLYVNGVYIAKTWAAQGRGHFSIGPIEVEMGNKIEPGSTGVAEVKLVVSTAKGYRTVALARREFTVPIQDSVEFVEVEPSPSELIELSKTIEFKAHVKYVLSSRSRGSLGLVLKAVLRDGSAVVLAKSRYVSVPHGSGERLLLLEAKIPPSIKGRGVEKVVLYVALWPEGARMTNIFDKVVYELESHLSLRIYVQHYAARDMDLLLDIPLSRARLRSIGVDVEFKVFAVDENNNKHLLPYKLSDEGVLDLSRAVAELGNDEYLLVVIDSRVSDPSYIEEYATKRFFPKVYIPLIPVRDQEDYIRKFRVYLGASNAKEQRMLLRNCFILKEGNLLLADPRLGRTRVVEIPANSETVVVIRSIPAWIDRLRYAMYGFLKDAGVRPAPLTVVTELELRFGMGRTQYVPEGGYLGLGYIEIEASADSFFDFGNLDLVGLLHEFAHAVRAYAYPDKVLDSRCGGPHDRYTKAQNVETAYDEAHSHFFSMLVADYAVSKGILEKEIFSLLKRRDPDYVDLFDMRSVLTKLRPGEGSWVEGAVAGFLFKSLYITSHRANSPEPAIQAYRAFYRACNLYHRVFNHFPRSIDDIAPFIAVVRGDVENLNVVKSVGQRYRINYFAQVDDKYTRLTTGCFGKPCLSALLFVAENGDTLRIEGSRIGSFTLKSGTAIPIAISSGNPVKLLYGLGTVGILIFAKDGSLGSVVKLSEASWFGRGGSIELRGTNLFVEKGRVFVKVTSEGKKEYGLRLVAGKSLSISPRCALELEVGGAKAMLYVVEGEVAISLGGRSYRVTQSSGIEVDLESAKIVREGYVPEDSWWDNSPPMLLEANAPRRVRLGMPFSVTILVDDDSGIARAVLYAVNEKHKAVAVKEMNMVSEGVFRASIRIASEGSYALMALLIDNAGNKISRFVGFIDVSKNVATHTTYLTTAFSTTATTSTAMARTTRITSIAVSGTTIPSVEKTETFRTYTTPPEDNTLMYIGAGIVFLLLVIIGIAISRRRR